MALVTGFLRQKCQWIRRPFGEDEVDAYGQPLTAEPVTINCRWVLKAGWAQGLAGQEPVYSSEVLVDRPVREGDTLTYSDNGRTVGGVVKSVSAFVNAAGKEEGRKCYV